VARTIRQGTTRPTVRTDPALHSLAHINEAALVAEGPSGPVAVAATAAGEIKISQAGGGGAVSIADGADVTQGAIADAAVTSDAAGTVNAHLRGLVAILASVWNSVAGRLRSEVHDGGNVISVDDAGGSLTTDQLKASTATRSQVAATTTNGTTLLAANANRLGATIYNDSDKRLYLAMGSGATPTDYTAKLNSETYFEVPFDYSGIITGVWDGPSPTNGAKVTELTP
jgi:hypothetical protein